VSKRSTIPAGGWLRHADVTAQSYRRLHVRCLSVGLLIKVRRLR